MNRLTGYRSAAALVQKRTGSRTCRSPPRDARLVRICPMTGKRASEAYDRVLGEWFRPGDEPLDPCPAHVRLAVDARTGRPATRKTPRRFVELRTFADLPPRYASWAAATGLPRPPEPEWPPGAARFFRDAVVRLSIRSPEDGLRVLRDPETPPEQSTLALRVHVNPPVPQLVWYVDGAPYRVADYPYTVRWEHVFQARLIDGRTASSAVRVLVQQKEPGRIGRQPGSSAGSGSPAGIRPSWSCLGLQVVDGVAEGVVLLRSQLVEGLHEDMWPHVLIRCLRPPDHPKGLPCSKPAVRDLEMILVRGHEHTPLTRSVLKEDLVVAVFSEEITRVQDVQPR
jgi:hypothetical protein